MFEQRRVWRIAIFSLELSIIRRTPRHAVSFTHFSSGLIPYINHFHYGINIKQFSEWKSYCCCWVTNEATPNSTDVFTGIIYYSPYHPTHPINAYQSVMGRHTNSIHSHSVSLSHLYIKKSRAHHHDASDPKPLKLIFLLLKIKHLLTKLIYLLFTLHCQK